MNRSVMLLVDALINLALGIVLMFFPQSFVGILGVPLASTGFYRSILGAVLFGIGIALAIEWQRKPSGLTGLGLAGAIAINLCGGTVLVGWLLFGGLDIPVRGRVLLWGLTAALGGISGIEAALVRRRRDY